VGSRVPIHSLTELEQGDHIAWWRPEGYWHHALVEEVFSDKEQVLVLHYNGPSPNGLILVKGVVMQELLDMGREKGLLYKITYDSLYTTDMILERARSRLGEDKYNILTHNCEHYVRWCKTGTESCVSVQVQSFYWTVFRIIQKVFTCLSKDVLKFGIGRYSTEKGIGKAIASSNVQTFTWESISLQDFTHFCEYFSIVCILFIELFSMVLDVRRSHKLFQSHQLSKVEFTTMIFRRISQGTLGATGAVGGALLGQMYIPMPFIGGLLGSTLGAVLGHYVGHFEGFAFAYILRRLARYQQR
jgi:hypothetical protein